MSTTYYTIYEHTVGLPDYLDTDLGAREECFDFWNYKQAQECADYFNANYNDGGSCRYYVVDKHI